MILYLKTIAIFLLYNGAHGYIVKARHLLKSLILLDLVEKRIHVTMFKIILPSQFMDTGVKI